ncbi:MAG: tricarballylate utilization 4Fe-4S protein TcuB [Vicinamibacterales bacterium]
MPPAELLRRGEHTMTVCNSCRYCEQYCAVFPAMERRLTFTEADLAYLASLCHNCGECLYACQYAPPHEFGIDVPRTMAELRLHSYEEDCWPRPLARAFRRQGVLTGLALAAGFSAILVAATARLNPWALWPGRTDAEFYAIVPHGVMVVLFGAVGGFVALALGVSIWRYWRRIAPRGTPAPTPRTFARAVGDALTLRHLHASGPDCVSAEEARTPWRRWWHHATLGGFLLCFASTSVAAFYHAVFGWEAPHAYTSLPVLLGTAGGVGLAIGPAGQWWLRRRRDPALADPEQRGLDASLLLLLWLTSATGLLLLVLRTRAVMGPLLLVHLGVVLGLFVTLPYGKFVHGLYRLAALVKDAAERDADRSV